jgi:hypothetical protein
LGAGYITGSGHAVKSGRMWTSLGASTKRKIITEVAELRKSFLFL